MLDGGGAGGETTGAAGRRWRRRRGKGGADQSGAGLPRSQRTPVPQPPDPAGGSRRRAPLL